MSANDILQSSLDPNEYRIVHPGGVGSSSGGDRNETGGGIDHSSSLKELNLIKEIQNSINNNNNNNGNNEADQYENVPLNEDEDPIIIKKPNKEEIVYKQNVFIRWLQPPTPPPPAPIISNQSLSLSHFLSYFI